MHRACRVVASLAGLAMGLVSSSCKKPEADATPQPTVQAAASSASSASGSAAAPPVASEPALATSSKPPAALLEKARAAGLAGNPAEVRRLLEERVRGGHATPEEVRLVKESCKQMQDHPCVDDIKAKYP